jgi:hypothetical protein
MVAWTWPPALGLAQTGVGSRNRIPRRATPFRFEPVSALRSLACPTPGRHSDHRSKSAVARACARPLDPYDYGEAPLVLIAAQLRANLIEPSMVRAFHRTRHDLRSMRPVALKI